MDVSKFQSRHKQRCLSQQWLMSENVWRCKWIDKLFCRFRSNQPPFVYWLVLGYLQAILYLYVWSQIPCQLLILLSFLPVATHRLRFIDFTDLRYVVPLYHPCLMWAYVMPGEYKSEIYNHQNHISSATQMSWGDIYRNQHTDTTRMLLDQWPKLP